MNSTKIQQLFNLMIAIVEEFWLLLFFFVAAIVIVVCTLQGIIAGLSLMYRAKSNNRWGFATLEFWSNFKPNSIKILLSSDELDTVAFPTGILIEILKEFHIYLICLLLECWSKFLKNFTRIQQSFNSLIAIFEEFWWHLILFLQLL